MRQRRAARSTPSEPLPRNRRARNQVARFDVQDGGQAIQDLQRLGPTGKAAHPVHRRESEPGEVGRFCLRQSDLFQYFT
jgi:hypothetical protein